MRSLEELASWAYHAGQDSEVEPPLAIHAKFYPPDDQPARERDPKTGERLHRPHAEIIGGKPFTRAFVRYIDDDHRAMTPIRRALRRMKSPNERDLSMEFRICWAIVECGHLYANLSSVFRAGESYLRPAAGRGLALLYELTQREKANEPQLKPFKSSEESSNVLPKGTRPPNGPRRGSRPAQRRADLWGISHP
jgi:hypothetical protein